MINKKFILRGFTDPTIPIEEMEKFYEIDPETIPHNRPYVWYMFIDTMDGRGTFLHPGKAGGYHVALGHFKEDPVLSRKYPEVVAGHVADGRLLQFGWAVADAMLAGAGILNAEAGNEWRIWDKDLMSYRESLGKKPTIRVLLTGSGSVNLEERVFSPEKEYETLVFTASEGMEALEKKGAEVERSRGYDPLKNARVYVLEEGRELTDLGKMMSILREEHGVRLLDVQGGPKIAGLLTVNKLFDEYRLTKSPQIIGDRYYSDGKARERPTAFTFPDGFTFNPDNSVLALPIEADRQVGGHTFMRRSLIYRH